MPGLDRASCGTLLLEGLVQEHLYVGLIRKPFSCARSWAAWISGTGSRMVTVFKGTARLALPDFSARFMISVAAAGWLSHHLASAASVRNFGIVICIF